MDILKDNMKVNENLEAVKSDYLSWKNIIRGGLLATVGSIVLGLSINPSTLEVLKKSYKHVFQLESLLANGAIPNSPMDVNSLTQNMISLLSNATNEDIEILEPKYFDSASYRLDFTVGGHHGIFERFRSSRPTELMKVGFTKDLIVHDGRTDITNPKWTWQTSGELDEYAHFSVTPTEDSYFILGRDQGYLATRNIKNLLNLEEHDEKSRGWDLTDVIERISEEVKSFLPGDFTQSRIFKEERPHNFRKKSGPKKLKYIEISSNVNEPIKITKFDYYKDNGFFVLGLKSGKDVLHITHSDFESDTPTVSFTLNNSGFRRWRDSPRFTFPNLVYNKERAATIIEKGREIGDRLYSVAIKGEKTL